MASEEWAVSDETLLSTLVLTLQSRVHELGAQHLANTAWAFASAGRSDAPMFVSLARAVEQHVAELEQDEMTVESVCHANAN